MTKIRKKQFTVEEKQEILEFEKSNTIKETELKFNVTRSSLYRWKKQIKNNESLESKTGDHTKTTTHKKKLSNGKLYFNTKDISKLSREQLEEYAQFWAIVGKFKKGL